MCMCMHMYVHVHVHVHDMWRNNVDMHMERTRMFGARKRLFITSLLAV